ncbi:MAG: SAM-dependent chlorinase/fluorinase [Candidatus Micrarchaeota archaeon]
MPRIPLITLATDFGVQSHGVAAMKGAIFEICPQARVIDLAHGLPDYNITEAARTMETAASMPKGVHVCVADPGVGTQRKAIAIKTGRGDCLVGPDNGVLIPATRFLGGIAKAVEITNEKFMRHPVSHVFHGRDIFAPAAAYLAKGLQIERLGPKIGENELKPGPYNEAAVINGKIEAHVISINKFGSIRFNVTRANGGQYGLKAGRRAVLEINGRRMRLAFANTFADVGVGEEVLFFDEYGRVEAAVNQGSFASRHLSKIGQKAAIRLEQR